MSFAFAESTSSLLQRSIYEACGEDRLSPSSTDSTHLCPCECEYHAPRHSLTNSGEEPEALPPHADQGYPSLLGVLSGITPEACEALQKRKRSREELDGEEEEAGSPTPLSTGVDIDQTDEIAAVMGFGTFSSSKKFPPESSH